MYIVQTRNQELDHANHELDHAGMGLSYRLNCEVKSLFYESNRPWNAVFAL